MVHQGFKQGPKHENLWCEPGTASKGKRRAGERVLLDWLGEGGNVSIQSVRSKGKAGQKCKGSFPLPSLSLTPSFPPSFPRLLFISSLYSFFPSFVLCWKFRFVYETSWFVIQLISFYCRNTYGPSKLCLQVQSDPLTSGASETQRGRHRRRVDSPGSSAKTKEQRG